MPLDPQMLPIVEVMNAGMGAIDLWNTPVSVIRQGFGAALDAAGDPIEVGKVLNRTIPGPAGELPVRIYWPKNGRGPYPILVFFHGGGFVLCNLDSHDGTCRELCNGSNAVVVSVDYRLAPEAKFPAAPEDCYAATKWVADNAAQLGVDSTRLAIGGDSAGGNLTAVVALMARDRNGPKIAHQLMIYPVTDCAFDTDSYIENGEGYMLSKDMMRWFWVQYLADMGDASEPYASPLRAADLGGLPPASIVTAEFDPLRDEGQAYAKRLQDAGVPCELDHVEGVIHGFFAMTAAVDRAQQAMERACERLRKALGS